MPNRSRWVSLGWAGAAALLAAAGLLPGCGEQDLYKVPDSPYRIIARLPLPSAPEDVAVLGNHAYIAGGEAGLHVVDISDPHNPVLKETFDTKKFAESIKVASTPVAGGGIVDIAFVVEGTEGITTYDVTDPDSTISFQQGTTAVDGNGLFIEVPASPSEPYIVYLAENWKGMRLFESDLAVPGLLRYNGVFTSTPGYAKAISVVNGWAYVADNEMGVSVVDVRIRTLGVVKTVSSVDTPGRALGIQAIVPEGSTSGYAYVADGPTGLVILQINGGETPVITSILRLPAVVRSIVVRDGTAFLAAQDGGLMIVDVRDPVNPVTIGMVPTPYATGVAVARSGAVVVSDRTEGLIVLGGPGPFEDRTPPATIGDLAAAGIDSTTIRLTWRAPGDDLFNGVADRYDIRYSTSTITDANWTTASQPSNEPIPEPGGTVQSFDVTDLVPGTAYYFAVKTTDGAGNESRLSNVASATTPLGNVPPSLSQGEVSPNVGAPGSTLFAFQVTYTDGDGDLPEEALVSISGETHAMTLVSGEPKTGARYRYETTLDLGRYEHFFRFSDGRNPAVVSAVVAGPFVGESFAMGSPTNEVGRDPDEVLHTVVVTRSVEISDHEVTQAEYQSVMGVNPSRFVGNNRPVENVTWFDAIAYCNALSIREGKTPAYTVDGPSVVWNKDADGWRLPTEAEWERACRAGTTTAFSSGGIRETACVDSLGRPDPSLDAVGWYCGNSPVSTQDVKEKQPNAAGLYDMHGNVWEWCWDWYGDLTADVALDPTGPESGIQRVRRGGSWYHYARVCRSASRDAYFPNSKDDVLGFRVVRTVTR